MFAKQMFACVALATKPAVVFPSFDKFARLNGDDFISFLKIPFRQNLGLIQVVGFLKKIAYQRFNSKQFHFNNPFSS
jgi:hypothetical protein